MSIADSKKLRAAFQPPGSCASSIYRLIARHNESGNPALSRQAIAAACAASCDDLAATFGCHTRTETMATLANKLRGLVGTLHLFKHRGVRPFLSLQFARSVVVARKLALKPRPNVRRLIGTKSHKVNYCLQRWNVGACPRPGGCFNMILSFISDHGRIVVHLGARWEE